MVSGRVRLASISGQDLFGRKYSQQMAPLPRLAQLRPPSHASLASLVSPAGVFDMDLGSTRHAASGTVFSGVLDSNRSQLTHGREPLTNSSGGTAMQRLQALCCEVSPFASQLALDLLQLREAFTVSPYLPIDSPAAARRSSDDSGGRSSASSQPSSSSFGSSPPNTPPEGADPDPEGLALALGMGGSPQHPISSSSFSEGSYMDVQGIARELLSRGYLVQVRESEAGGEKLRDVRRCLQQLRHRFIVCLGARAAADDLPPQPVPELLPQQQLPVQQQPPPQQLPHLQVLPADGASVACAVTNGGSSPIPESPVGESPAVSSSDDGGSCVAVSGCSFTMDAVGNEHYLPEPLIVEPSFREQFVIAHPTASYGALLEAVPLVFVGTLSHLEAIVTLLCEEMAAAFKLQALAIPPWRSKAATLSKWAPKQLSELSGKIAAVQRQQQQQLQGQQQQQGQGQQRAVASVDAAAAPPVSAQSPEQLPCACEGLGAPPVAGAAAGNQAATATSQAQQQQRQRQQHEELSHVLAQQPDLASGALMFPRCTSKEWKPRPQNEGQKAKSLLAAALKECGASPPKEAMSHQRPAASGSASQAAPAAAGASAAAAAPQAGKCGGGAGGVRGGADSAIRTVPNETGWGCITTVRWGALHQKA